MAYPTYVDFVEHFDVAMTREDLVRLYYSGQMPEWWARRFVKYLPGLKNMLSERAKWEEYDRQTAEETVR